MDNIRPSIPSHRKENYNNKEQEQLQQLLEYGKKLQKNEKNFRNQMENEDEIEDLNGEWKNQKKFKNQKPNQEDEYDKKLLNKVVNLYDLKKKYPNSSEIEMIQNELESSHEGQNDEKIKKPNQIFNKTRPNMKNYTKLRMLDLPDYYRDRFEVYHDYEEFESDQVDIIPPPNEVITTEAGGGDGGGDGGGHTEDGGGGGGGGGDGDGDGEGPGGGGGGGGHHVFGLSWGPALIALNVIALLALFLITFLLVIPMCIANNPPYYIYVC